MTAAKQGRIKEMSFDPAEDGVRGLEISLTAVVEACQGSHILQGTNGELVDGYADNDASEDN